MGRKNTESHATDAELAWFNLEKYSGLLGQADPETESLEAREACYRQWAALVRDRVQLSLFIDSGELKYVASLFEQVKLSPLAPLGFSKTYVGAAHAANSATIKAMTTNRVKWLHEALIQAKAPEHSIVDVVLLEDAQSSFSEYAHLMVSTTATDNQLVEDFKAWLEGWRLSTASSTGGDYRLKIGNWFGAKVLQYHDLRLFTKISGREISVKKRFSLLPPLDAQQLRRLSQLEKAVFSDDIAQRLMHLANSDQLALGQRGR